MGGDRLLSLATDRAENLAEELHVDGGRSLDLEGVAQDSPRRLEDP